MAPLDTRNADDRKGVWKSAPGKGRKTPKGRQPSDQALEEVQALLGDKPRRSDLLIEFLHLIQDRYKHLSADHICALASEMRMSQAEVYEVASFYAHFDVVREGEDTPPDLTIRVCDSLSCELAGAQELIAKLTAQYNGGREVRVLRAPCVTVARCACRRKRRCSRTVSPSSALRLRARRVRRWTTCCTLCAATGTRSK